MKCYTVMLEYLYREPKTRKLMMALRYVSVYAYSGAEAMEKVERENYGSAVDFSAD